MALLLPEERRRFMLFCFFDVLITVLDILSLAGLVAMINFLVHPATADARWPAAYFSTQHILLPAGVLVLLFGLKNLLAYNISSRQHRFVYQVACRLSQKKMLQYLEGSYQQYTTTDTAVHIKTISQQPVEFGHYILSGLQQIITQSILVGCTIIAILLFNATLFLLLLLILLPPVLLVLSGIKKRVLTSRTQAKANSEKALQYLKEALAGFVESKLYQRNHFFTERYTSRQQQLNTYLSGLQTAQVIPGRLMEVVAVLGLFVLIVLSSIWGAAGISLLTMGAFIAAAYKIIPGLVNILNRSTTIRAYEYVIAALPLAPAQQAVQMHFQPASISTVQFKNVSFQYLQRSILHHFNCSLQAGGMAGISGASGKGKTTLINILLGFEHESCGTISINGHPTDAAMRQQCWPHIAYVKQQPFLIHDSILTNITLGENDIDHQRLQAAIHISGVDEMAAQFPGGLNQLITEQGKNISGGQRQRIALARALYKNASLIILDEPFNELDHATENRLLQHFKQLALTGTIVILITHQAASLSYCNTIISLDEN